MKIYSFEFLNRFSCKRPIIVSFDFSVVRSWQVYCFNPKIGENAQFYQLFYLIFVLMYNIHKYLLLFFFFLVYYVHINRFFYYIYKHNLKRRALLKMR